MHPMSTEYAQRERARKAAKSAQWQRELRKKMRAAGFRALTEWVHQDDYARERKRLRSLPKRREYQARKGRVI